jgi:L-serine dehydratase
MAAAAIATLSGLSNEETEYAAEIAMEHNLGLTCDPVGGLVQIPCIERNAVACMRAISCVNLSRFLCETRKISFDDVIATMYQTGRDMNEKYRETSHGGLAVIYKPAEPAQ